MPIKLYVAYSITQVANNHTTPYPISNQNGTRILFTCPTLTLNQPIALMPDWISGTILSCCYKTITRAWLYTHHTSFPYRIALLVYSVDFGTNCNLQEGLLIYEIH